MAAGGSEKKKRYLKISLKTMAAKIAKAVAANNTTSWLCKRKLAAAAGSSAAWHESSG